jgi:hypothetical protein
MYFKIARPFSFTFTILLFLHSSFSQQLTGTARFSIANGPGNAIVKVDGSIVLPDTTNWYTIMRGIRKIEFFLSDTLVYKTIRLFSENEDKKFIFYCKDDCGGVEVQSVPPGAHLVIDDEYTTVTPSLHGLLPPGIHSLRLEMPGRTPVYKDFEITERNITKITVSMEPSQEFKDSLQLSSKHIRKTRQRVRASLLCVFSASFASASVWYNTVANHYISRANKASNSYDHSNGNFETFKTDYYQSRQKADKAIEIRNQLAIAAGVVFTGFVISLVF